MVGGQGSTDIVVQGSVFHDATLAAGSSAHTECAWIGSVQGLDISGSRFERCAVMDVFFTRCCPAGETPPTSGVELHDNTLCKPTPDTSIYTVQVHPLNAGVWHDIDISSNRLGGPILGQPGPNVQLSPNGTAGC
jgi:hypothetical protein